MVPGQDTHGGSKSSTASAGVGNSPQSASLLLGPLCQLHTPSLATPQGAHVLHVKAQTQQTRWRITAYMCLESLPEQRINMPKITPTLTAAFK